MIREYPITLYDLTYFRRSRHGKIVEIWGMVLRHLNSDLLIEINDSKFNVVLFADYMSKLQKSAIPYRFIFPELSKELDEKLKEFVLLLK